MVWCAVGMGEIDGVTVLLLVYRSNEFPPSLSHPLSPSFLPSFLPSVLQFKFIICQFYGIADCGKLSLLGCVIPPVFSPMQLSVSLDGTFIIFLP